jgi:hypothetical protein
VGEELAGERGGLPEASDQSDHDLSLYKEIEATITRYRGK